ncbi:MAG: NAD(P)/FAD-dependent oxidoreductase [Candidatus Zixiibacteriota bacterium]
MKPAIAIIGGGPAGISAAIQLKRYNLDPVLFEEAQIGGLLKNAWRVENLPNSPAGVSGRQIIERFKGNLEIFRINIINQRVINLDYQYDKFLITTADNIYDCDIAIIATGTIPIRHSLEKSAPENIRQKIFYEIFPIGMAVDKNVLVVGAGDAAFDYSLNLAQQNRATILNRSNQIKALPSLQKLVRDNRSIDYLENSEIEQIRLSGEDRLSVLINKENDKITLEVDNILFAIGRIEQKEFYSKNLTPIEYNLMKRGLLFLIGDIKNGIFRQASIAIGDGIKCAMEIYHNLNSGRK